MFKIFNLFVILKELRPADVERLQSELNALERTVKALLVNHL